jgi:hypothetical protein
LLLVSDLIYLPQFLCGCPCILVWVSPCVYFCNLRLDILYGPHGELIVNFFPSFVFHKLPLQSTTYGFSRASSTFAFAPSFSLFKSTCSSIINLLDAKPEINADPSQGISITETFNGQIQFQNVHFHYPRRPNVCVLRSLSFKVELGTYIALVGASGSGKSTVSVGLNYICAKSVGSLIYLRIQLIERFYNSSAGHIYVCITFIYSLMINHSTRLMARLSLNLTYKNIANKLLWYLKNQSALMSSIYHHVGIHVVADTVFRHHSFQYPARSYQISGRSHSGGD